MTVRGADRTTVRNELLTTSEAAQRLRVSVRTVARLIASGQLPHVRPRPTLIRIDSDDLCAYLNARRQEAVPALSAFPRPTTQADPRRTPRGPAQRFLDHLQVP